tara:strand:- start:8458 stop:8790 length:333 start_codon:yes stop_codon:yes gene_type:complete
MAITTIHQLAIATGTQYKTLIQRTANYPIPEKPRSKYRGRKVYRIGVLENWHKITENIINCRGHSVQVEIKEGEQAKLMGKRLKSNPYVYVSELGKFCAWAAGWVDAKKS